MESLWTSSNLLPMPAQSYKDPLQIHGLHIHIKVLQRGQLGFPAPDGDGPPPPQILGLEDGQPLTGPVHLVRPAGDSAELPQKFVGGGVFCDMSLVQDEHPLKDRGGLLNDVGGDDKGAARLGEVVQEGRRWPPSAGSA